MTGNEVPSVRPGIAVLLALRFALELALLASYVVVLTALVDGALGWVLGVLAAVVVAAVWGIYLAPRRRVDLPVAARVGIELVLFALAAVGLALAGHPVWGAVLAVAELVVVGLLRGPDEHAL